MIESPSRRHTGLLLSMLGPAFAVSRLLPRSSGIAKGVILAVLILFAVRSVAQERHWRTPLTFNLHAVRVNPDSWFFHNNINLGALHKKMGEREAAVTCFVKAIDLDPDRAEAYNNLGLIHLESGSHDEAIPLFTRATKVEASSPIPWHNLGTALLVAGRGQEAIAALRQAIANDRGYAPAYNVLSAAYLTLKRYRRAVAAADKAKALGLIDPVQMRAVAPYR